MKSSIRWSMILSLIVFSFAVNAQSCHGGGGGESTPMHSENKAVEPSPRPTMQTLCPVMKNPVDRTISAIWEGNEHFPSKRVYFCCNDCVHKFNKDPERYVKKLYKMNQFVETVVDIKEDAVK